MSLWTSWSFLLGMAGVYPTSEVGTPIRRSYVFSDDVSGDTGGCSARRALKPKFYQSTQIMVTAGILPFRKNSHGRAGNRTRDPMISCQIL